MRRWALSSELVDIAGDMGPTQKMSYTNNKLNSTPAVRNESSFKIATVLVARHRAMRFESRYGRSK